MKYVTGTLACGALLAAHVLAAQAADAPGAPAGTPKACLEANERYQDAQYAAARAGQRAFDGAAVRRKESARARKCAATFDPATIDVTLLADLGTLYIQAEEPELADRAFDRAINARDLSDTARAGAGAAAMLAYLDAARDSASQRRALVKAEGYLPRIDSIPGAYVQQFRARNLLLDVYNNYDVDSGIVRVGHEMLALARRMSPADVADPRVAWGLVTVHLTLAAQDADHLAIDSALGIIRRAQTDFPSIASAPEQVRDELKEAITRYEMIGQPAPTLRADYWLNGPAGPLNRGVTVIMFTANWCHSCRDSYPAVAALASEYGAKGLHFVLDIDMDGIFQGVEMTPEQEVEANRRYYVMEHGFTCPIALQRPSRQRPPGYMPPTDPANSGVYHLAYLPEYAVVDQQGIIRAVLQGWDATHHRETVLRAVIAKLLGSPGTA